MNAQLKVKYDLRPWIRCGVFLINLDRSPERLQAMHEILMKSKIPYERISGFDASKEDLSACPLDVEAFRKNHGRLAPRKGEIGVYQSHIKAIQKFFESDKEFAIIFEDDVILDENFTESIDQLLKWNEAWDVVPLFHFHSGGSVAIKKNQGLELTVFFAHISSAAAYILNKKAAKKLLENLKQQKACIDHSLFEAWVHGLKLRGISPMPVNLSGNSHASTINSEFSNKISVIKRLPTYFQRIQRSLRTFKYGFFEFMLNFSK